VLTVECLLHIISIDDQHFFTWVSHSFVSDLRRYLYGNRKYNSDDNDDDDCFQIVEKHKLSFRSVGRKGSFFVSPENSSCFENFPRLDVYIRVIGIQTIAVQSYESPPCNKMQIPFFFFICSWQSSWNYI